MLAILVVIALLLELCRNRVEITVSETPGKLTVTFVAQNARGRPTTASEDTQ